MPLKINASSPIVTIDDSLERLIEVSEEQPLKAPVPIFKTPSPIVTLLSSVSPKKVKSPMLALGMLAVVSAVQRANTPSPSVFTLAGRAMAVRPVPLNA